MCIILAIFAAVFMWLSFLTWEFLREMSLNIGILLIIRWSIYGV